MRVRKGNCQSTFLTANVGLTVFFAGGLVSSYQSSYRRF